MSAAIAAAEANRSFSNLLGQVKNGRTVTITSHGRPVAKMMPVGVDQGITTAARATLFARLKAAGLTQAGTWTRDDLYEESR